MLIMHIPVFGPHGNQAHNPDFAAVALMPLIWKEDPILADLVSFLVDFLQGIIH
jgi:hypothetical protein